jgi:lysozyme
VNKFAEELLIEEEGRRAQPYWDNLGFVTGGIGHLLDPRKPCPLPEAVIDLLFDHDFKEKSAQAQQIPGFMRLNEIQQAALISMVFQLGFEPFDGDGFKDFRDMMAALARGDVKRAAAEGLDSKWAKKDTPRRAQRQMKMLETGVWVPWSTFT